MKFKKLLKIGLPLLGMTAAVAVVMPLTLTSCNSTTSTETGNNNQTGGSNQNGGNNQTGGSQGNTQTPGQDGTDGDNETPNGNQNSNVNVISLDQYQANKIEVTLQYAISQITLPKTANTLTEKSGNVASTSEEQILKYAGLNLKHYLTNTAIGGHIKSMDLTIVPSSSTESTTRQSSYEYKPKKKVNVKITLQDGFSLQLQKDVKFSFNVNENVLTSKKPYSTGIDLAKKL